MYVKNITYKDLDDITVTDTLYFNMTRTELLEYVGSTIDIGRVTEENEAAVMEAAEKKLIRMLNFKNGSDIISFIKDLILRSYGERSADGRSFIKLRPDGERLADSFAQTMAFDALMTELLDDPKKADDFMLSIMPKSISSTVKEKAQKEKTSVIDVTPTNT